MISRKPPENTVHMYAHRRTFPANIYWFKVKVEALEQVVKYAQSKQ